MSYQIMRYLITGGLVYVLDSVVFLIIIHLLDGGVVVANSAGHIFGAILGFLVHRSWTFAGNYQRSVLMQVALYIILVLTNILVSSYLLVLLMDDLNIGALTSRIIADIFVIFLAFVWSKYSIFRLHKEE